MKIVLMEGLGVSEEVINQHAQKLEAQGHTFTVFAKNADPAVQEEELRDADIAILANMPLAASAVEKAENLKFIDVAFTGIDHIPMDVCRSKNITVSNASGYATDAVAEWCIGAAVSLLRSFEETGKKCKEGSTKDGYMGSLLSGKTLGIIGVGAIGKRLAALAKAFNCHTLGYSRSPIKSEYIDEEVTLDELLKRSDIVSIHCPLNEGTKGLLSAEKIALMKASAILLNTARGAVVDSEALAKALNEGKLAGAGIDVYEKEPPLSVDHPLLHSKHTLVTPHIGFFTKEAMAQRCDIVFDNLDAYLSGSPVNVMK